MTSPSSSATIPRVTDKYLESLIATEDYHHFPGTRATVCCLTLKNSFTIIEEAVCASPSQFDRDRGRQQARRNALWRLKQYEYYLLRQRLYEANALTGEPPHEP